MVIFLGRLYDYGMLTFLEGEGNGASLGVFCVAKKSGKLRLIFDTRKLNRRSKDPPSVNLPTASAFSSIEIDENCIAFLASGDLSNAFYTMEIPLDLTEQFTLQPISAGFLRARLGSKPKYDTVLRPALRVLPMGWSHSLRFCQALVADKVASIVGAQNVIQDSIPQFDYPIRIRR